MKVAAAFAIIPLAAWIALTISPYGLLIREDPMYAAPSNVVEDIACVYFTGLSTKTIFKMGQRNGASCRRIYRSAEKSN